jgi:hypothetical protein
MFKRRSDEHFLEAGCVYCPLREHDVELDVCAGCRWSTAIDLQAKPPVVRCRPQARPLWAMCLR